ncbi:MAG: dipeptide ABC transporter permease DppC, partial [Acidimicrobiia bacterium]|nr:dipeptide ABC transporter permease DppC [Acidimicrobiia bacterium]
MTATTPEAVVSRRAGGGALSKLRRLGRTVPIGSSIILGALLIFAIFAPLLARYEPTKSVPGLVSFTPPGWQDGGTWERPLGTDEQGRDVLSRLIYGA